jgi:D-ribose pyranase
LRRGGIINANLAGAMGRLGHTDLVVVCDAGLPIPPGPAVVDLAFRFGVPAFETVLSGLLEELVVEGAIAAEEVEAQNPRSHELLKARLPELGARAPRGTEAHGRRGEARGSHRGGHPLLQRHPSLRGFVLS